MNLEKQDVEDLYQPPTSAPSPTIDTASSAFYVVSKRKFFILSITTFSFYAVYWFWRQWTEWRNKTGENIWPIARAIFSIFFAHSLFKKIETKASQVDSRSHKNLDIAATIYVIVELAFNLMDKIPMIGIVYLVLTILFVCILSASVWQAQAQANIASFDSDGRQNDEFSVANYIWSALGLLFWITVISTALSSAYTVY